jgi:hypothetical protein
MDRDSSPPERDDQRGLPRLFPQTVPEPGSEASTLITEVIALHQEFPAWAIWLPRRGGCWTAVRPASARAPGPDLPMIWVHAATAAELAVRMRSGDAQVGGL